jgi:uncharacterized protein (DUF1697 family)
MKYLALLRGINVGGNNKVDMKTLKEVFESIGFTDVTTYINSGNVIFTADNQKIESIKAKIEHAIQTRFDLPIKVLIRNSQNILDLCSSIPPGWQNDTEQKTDILFLWDEYDNPESLKLIKAASGIDNLLYKSGAIIWNLHRANLSKSGMAEFIGTELYKNMTARNINTVRRLKELF